MEMQNNGVPTTMKTKQGKRSNSNNKGNCTNLNIQNNLPLNQNLSQEQKEENFHHEILLLIDIKVNEYSQLSNLYTLTIDQKEKKVLDFNNFEIGLEQNIVKLKDALDNINSIKNKYASNPSFFIVYPKKTIPSVLFKIFRQHKIQVSELSFTNTFISLGQLMPNQYIVDENILFNRFLTFIDLKLDEELSQLVSPIQTSIQQNQINSNDKYLENVHRQASQSKIRLIQKAYSQSIDLHGIQSIDEQFQQAEKIFLSQGQNKIPTIFNNSVQTQIGIMNETELKNSQQKQEQQSQIYNLQQSDNILSSTSRANTIIEPSLSKPSSLLSSSQNTPTQQQLFHAETNSSSSSLLNSSLQSDQQKEQPKQNAKNISSLFSLSNKNQDIMKSETNPTTSFLFSKQIPFSSYQSYSMQPEKTIFSQFSTTSHQKRPTSLSLDSGSILGGQSSLFSNILSTKQIPSQINSNTTFLHQSSHIQSQLITSPLTPIQENTNERSEMSLERNQSEINQQQKIAFPSCTKEFEIQSNNCNISSSSSICSNSTYASNKLVNDSYSIGNFKELKFSPQLNFFILVIKLIKEGFQFKKECIINFKINLTIEIKMKYGNQIQDLIQEFIKKISPNPNLSQDEKQGEQNLQKKNELNKSLCQQQATQDLIKNGYNITPSNQGISKKQILSQHQQTKQNLGDSSIKLPTVSTDSKQKIQEELIQRSQEVQQKLSKNEENKSLDLLFVIDFECNQPGYEIIEFPILVIDLKKQRIIDTFHTYVKPTTSPKINPYISKITGIQQKDVASAPSFLQVIQKVEAFLSKYKDYEGCILYDCDSDCNYIKSEFVNKNYVPKSDVFFSYINLRKVFPLEISGGVINKSLSHAQQILQMEFQGNKHKGIDDARNQALVCIELVKRGFNFSQFMIQPQFLKQDPKQCVKNNLFNLYEFNTKFLLIKLDIALQEAPPVVQQGQYQRNIPACLANNSKKYLKFTCFLTEKNNQVNSIHRIKDSTFYFDLANAQASGAGVTNLPLSSHQRNIFYNQPHVQENLLNSSQIQQNNQTFSAPQQVNKQQYNYSKDQKGQRQYDEHSRLVEKTFYNQFSNYLKRHGIQRNKTAFVLLGFDKNEFSNFQKAFNLTQYEKELFFNEKIIYIDENLVQFSGFLDIYKLKDHHYQNQRKNSASITPYKRKRSMSDDLLSTQIKVNLSHTVQFQDPQQQQISTNQIPQRKNSLKNSNQSPMIKPASTSQLIETINLNQKDDYTIIHKGDAKHQQNDNEKNAVRQSRRRSGKDFINSYDPKGLLKQLEKQQQQQGEQVILPNQQQQNNNQQNIEVQNNQSSQQIIVQPIIQNSVQLNNNNNNNNNNISSNQAISQNNNIYSKEQICQFLLNDEFSINFINFILVNRKKLQEYQDLAYHWQYINSQPQ